MKKSLLLLASFWAIMASATAWADFYVVAVPAGVGTRITSLPYSINNPGFYYLAGDLTSAGNGITINVDNVTIDLMGFSLAGPGSGSGDGIVIGSSSAVSNVEIRNGTVRSFPGDGIAAIMAGGGNRRIINVRLVNNGSRGLHMAGHSALVQNCVAIGNGNAGISLTGDGSGIIDSISRGNGGDGISCTGMANNLIGNVVTNNGGHGFNLSYLWASAAYVIDRNSAYGNTGGTLNGIPPAAKFGINAGPGFP